ncbi:hypothetical protein Dimus_003987, partial [Dionaea muscipula]
YYISRSRFALLPHLHRRPRRLARTTTTSLGRGDDDDGGEEVKRWSTLDDRTGKGEPRERTETRRLFPARS